METGLKFFGWLASRLFFFSNGKTTACPYFRGKQPVARDLLKRTAMKGDSSNVIRTVPNFWRGHVDYNHRRLKIYFRFQVYCSVSEVGKLKGDGSKIGVNFRTLINSVKFTEGVGKIYRLSRIHI